jgi:alpha-beta hydrolase superfamily lysophospholipase
MNEIDYEESEKKNLIRKLMIICGPNGAPFEQYARNLRLEEIYLRNNIDVLLWNYRGYGLTTGSPSFSNIKKDAEAVIEFARKKNFWDTIGVHGISMGGLACCHIAGYYYILI